MSQDEQQHRGGFVPIGEPAGTPQARHHFTTLHQVNQLIEASEAEPDIGFMARLLALCSLPRTNPGDRLQFKRVNGPYTLGMIAGLGNKLPYGTLPRLLLAWVCTEAVRTQSRELVLGDSLSEFMRRLGIYSTSGGITGGRTRLRNQMRRLFGCTVSLIYEDARGEATLNAPIARRTEFWWGVGRSRPITLRLSGGASSSCSCTAVRVPTARLRCATTRTGSGQPAGNRAPLVAPAHPAAVAPPEGYGSEARRSGRAFGVYQCRPGRPKWKFRLERTHRRFARRARVSTIQNPDVNDTRLAVSAIASPYLAGDPMVTWRAWGIPVRCGAGMVALQTLLALYRFGDSTALLQLVNPLMWIGLGLFFVTGWVIGWVVERLLRGTTGPFRTLLLGATFLATPVAVAGSLVGGLFGPPGVLLYGLIPYLLLVGIPRLIGVVWTRHGS